MQPTVTVPPATAQSLPARWRHALKPASWPKLLVPTVLGQGLGLAVAPAWSWGAAAFGVAFTLALGVFIVLMNDWADVRVDRLKREMFPTGCSPKTIPDGLLSARAVLVVGLLAGVLALALAASLAGPLARPWLGALGLACVATFVAYSLPPLALNYRGGGELLETLGVGVLLPWVQAYALSGLVWSPHWAWLVGHAWLALASALASGLSDEESDRAGGKRTFTTMLGNGVVRAGVRTCLSLGALAWAVAGVLGVGPAPWVGLLAAVALSLHLPALRGLGAVAVTNAFEAQGLYKQALHQACWLATLTLAVGVVIASRVGP
ncbi:MAG: prenyltransferase [Candidatus Sericytochromatia bacterium]|nr:prenyltransferase [Candidatus Sericytochromatia bacterium]